MACSLADCERYPYSFGIVGIEEPKTRRLLVHAPRQHVLLECAGVANFIRRVLDELLAGTHVMSRLLCSYSSNAGIRMLLARCLDKRDQGHEASVADYTQSFSQR